MLLLTFSLILLCIPKVIVCSTESFEDIIKCISCCQEILEIRYPNGITIQPNAEVKPSQVTEKPEITYAADPKNLYTLITIDPDAPSRKKPIKRDWRHWLVVNIPGSEVDKGNVVSIHKGPGPPKDTGFHRYIFLVYKQAATINATSLNLNSTSESRASFDTQKFVRRHKLGDPRWCNVFRAQFEEK